MTPKIQRQDNYPVQDSENLSIQTHEIDFMEYGEEALESVDTVSKRQEYKVISDIDNVTRDSGFLFDFVREHRIEHLTVAWGIWSGPTDKSLRQGRLQDLGMTWMDSFHDIGTLKRVTLTLIDQCCTVNKYHEECLRTPEDAWVFVSMDIDRPLWHNKRQKSERNGRKASGDISA